MPITKTCDPNVFDVQLNVSAGEKLRYKVTGAPDAIWFLRSSTGEVILGHPASRETDWPSTTPPASTSQEHHTLAMTMAGTQTLRWRVERLGAGGNVIALLKDCTYASSGETSAHNDAITVNVL